MRPILYTFDIFDTTLFRKCGEADNVFVLLAQHLYCNNEKKRNDFLRWRRQAELERPGYKFSIEDVYNQEELDSLGEHDIHHLIQTEIQLEDDLLFGNAEIIKTIKSCRSRGCRVAFVSDSHLPGTFVKEILRRENAYQDGDGFFVCNRIKARNDDGFLYGIISERYRPRRWIHFSHKNAKVFFGKQGNGIKTVRVGNSYSNVELHIIKNASILPESYSLSILSGFSRYVRCHLENTQKVLIASDFVAPAYIPYVKHVINDASRRGLRTLFFVSRDGYIFQKIAECLPHNGIQLKYLFVSRNSLLRAFFHVASDNEKRLVKARETMSTCQDDYDRCAGYLKQEGVLEDNIALVDLGWYGSSRMMVNRIRKEEGKSPLFTYYWNTRKDVLPQQYGEFDVYNHAASTSPWLVFLLEEYFSACPWPSTIDYRKSDDDTLRPVFQDQDTYKDNPVAEVNLQVCKAILKLMSECIFDEVSLYAWMKSSVDFLINNDFYIDWAELSDHYKGKDFLLRKLTFKEMLDFVLCHDSFDQTNINASLNMTVGKKLALALLKLRDLRVKSYYRVQELRFRMKNLFP